ncbi:hypothetical protein GCM10011571_30260 [Marinithermofilum abyssi]|uniref:Uncharacterized protein n=1 Tax=Marinithermofilum abyssi TaxID=1571185 RepID=A0A8J2Y9L8_9BACL|nr:hypothetical protein GCM10011571_30260 [Marinithermofilum abyssi]
MEHHHEELSEGVYEICRFFHDGQNHFVIAQGGEYWEWQRFDSEFFYEGNSQQNLLIQNFVC